MDSEVSAFPEIPLHVLVQLQNQYLLKNEAITRAVELLHSHKVRPSSTSQYYIVGSRNQDKVEYLVDPATQMCGCPAGSHGRMCAHLIAVLIYRAVKQDDVVKSNAIITAREERAKELNRQTKRLEWVEELDYVSQDDFYKDWDTHDSLVYENSQTTIPFEEWMELQDKHLTSLYPKRPLYAVRHPKGEAYAR